MIFDEVSTNPKCTNVHFPEASTSRLRAFDISSRNIRLDEHLLRIRSPSLTMDPLELRAAEDVAAHKLERFNRQGPVKKTRLQREKEEVERKAKEEEEAASKAYLAFVEAFDAEDEGPSVPTGKSSRAGAKGFVRAGGEGYNPLRDRDLAGRQEASPPTPSGSSNPPGYIPTGPRSAYQRPTAQSVMRDNEVSFGYETSSPE